MTTMSENTTRGFGNVSLHQGNTGGEGSMLVSEARSWIGNLKKNREHGFQSAMPQREGKSCSERGRAAAPGRMRRTA